MLSSGSGSPARGADRGAEAFFFGAAIGELLLAAGASIGPHHLEVAAEATDREKGDVLAVRRPGRAEVATAAEAIALVVGELAHVTAVGAGDEDVDAGGAVADEGDALAVRRGVRFVLVARAVDQD